MTTRVRLTLVGAACFAVVVALPNVKHGTKGQVDRQRTGHRIRNLRQVRGSDHTVMIIAFDYATGAAFRIVRDETSGKVLYEQQLPGRPQSSREEFKEAVEIIGRDPKLAGFIRDGAVTEGGFIVDGPPGHPSQDRYIQIRLLTPDRSRLLRVVLVDLTVSVVAAASDWFQ
jgi:hypothetical protein